jgi:hypothetical protein
MKTATESAVIKAYDKSVKRLRKDHDLAAASTSAGFIIPAGQKPGKRSGFQVFVRVCRDSDELLKTSPESGGLLSP